MNSSEQSLCSEIFQRYLRYVGQNLTDDVKVEGMHISLIRDLSLAEFQIARKMYCQEKHGCPLHCRMCSPLIEVAKQIEIQGVVSLKSLFCSQFGSKALYKSDKAVRRFMQLPVVVLKLNGTLYVLEYSPYTEYDKLQTLIEKLVPEQKLSVGLSKEALKALCDMASTEADRKLLRVATTAGLSGSQAKTAYRIGNLHKERDQVAQAVQEYITIRHAVDDIVNAKEKVVLESFGVLDSDSEGEDLSDSLSNCESDQWNSDRNSDSDLGSTSDNKGSCAAASVVHEAGGQKNGELQIERTQMGNNNASGCGSLMARDPDITDKNVGRTFTPSYEHLLLVLRENKLNWFSFETEVELTFRNMTADVLDQMLLDFSDDLSESDLSPEEEQLVEQSRQAYLASRRERVQEEQQSLGAVLTDSESDDPEDWVGLRRPGSLQRKVFQDKVKKKKASFARLKKRMIAKEVTRRALLKRKVPTAVSKTLVKFPNIGKDIEKFARENRIGADAWRRTGVLTFTGNIKRGPKITYSRIKEHLEKKYCAKIGYGTIVQLCVVHNKRRLSARRYWGVANLRSRRARKGFNVRLNVDAHWSCAFYKSLDFIQLKDGKDKVVLNRDDAAGFRLDTTYTHKQHKILAEADKPELTTRTDYVNKYASVLQATSYLFMGTENTAESCVGVVKPQKVFPKNPAQHAADFEMLHSLPSIESVLKNKDVECIRVDGASDEGPSHLEVQFMWTERHLKMQKHCTVVTSRFSGGSYLNRVELLNGCLAVGHSNLFIPSTILGSNLGADSGTDKEKLHANLDAATDVYINSVSGTKCAGNPIVLVKGAQNERSKTYLERRDHLLTYLQGSKKKKLELEKHFPEEYAYFSKVWTIRNNHMVKNLPENYVFMLLPCYERNCPHPVCVNGKPNSEPVWYEGGPPLTYIPIPIPDPQRAWGSPCNSCVGFCCGHYLSPKDNIKRVQENGNGSCAQPPREVISDFVKRVSGVVTDEAVKNLAQKTALSITDVKLWIDHLKQIQTRRKQGAKKAAEKRRSTMAERKRGTLQKELLQYSHFIFSQFHTIYCCFQCYHESPKKQAY